MAAQGFAAEEQEARNGRGASGCAQGKRATCRPYNAMPQTKVRSRSPLPLTPCPLLQPLLPPRLPPQLDADAAQEPDDGVCAKVGGDAGADVELGVHLHEVEADHLRTRGMSRASPRSERLRPALSAMQDREDCHLVGIDDIGHDVGSASNH